MSFITLYIFLNRNLSKTKQITDTKNIRTVFRGSQNCEGRQGWLMTGRWRCSAWLQLEALPDSKERPLALSCPREKLIETELHADKKETDCVLLERICSEWKLSCVDGRKGLEYGTLFMSHVLDSSNKYDNYKESQGSQSALRPCLFVHPLRFIRKICVSELQKPSVSLQ